MAGACGGRRTRARRAARSRRRRAPRALRNRRVTWGARRARAEDPALLATTASSRSPCPKSAASRPAASSSAHHATSEATWSASRTRVQPARRDHAGPDPRVHDLRVRRGEAGLERPDGADGRELRVVAERTHAGDPDERLAPDASPRPRAATPDFGYRRAARSACSFARNSGSPGAAGFRERTAVVRPAPELPRRPAARSAPPRRRTGCSGSARRRGRAAPARPTRGATARPARRDRVREAPRIAVREVEPPTSTRRPSATRRAERRAHALGRLVPRGRVLGLAPVDTEPDAVPPLLRPGRRAPVDATYASKSVSRARRRARAGAP